ncbi:MAG: hypothetical protein JXB23_08960 [Candidatus Aminicenantes bacterium]|nr:hypothetical protein [Candidatus Aminicenantes bacterium]
MKRTKGKLCTIALLLVVVILGLGLVINLPGVGQEDKVSRFCEYRGYSNPVSRIFPAGNRIRVTVTCADADNTQTPVLSPPPTVGIHRSKGNASHIALPIIPSVPEEKRVLPLNMILGAAAVVLVLLIIIILAKRRNKTG